MLKGPTHLRGALLTGAVNVVWFLLALRRPELHYHFAPLIAAALWPLSLRTAGRASMKDTQIGVAGAIGLTLLTTLIIELTGNMNGPNFLHAGPAWPEAVLFAIVGALITGRAASRERPGLLGGLVDATSS